MGKYLNYYKKCMEAGGLPAGHNGIANGLCNDRFVGADVLRWFAPDAPHFTNVRERNEGWWGTEIPYTSSRVRYAFCPLRQNMVLLLAAIHDEDFNDLKR